MLISEALSGLTVLDGVTVLAEAVYFWAEGLALSQDAVVTASVGAFARSHVDPVYHSGLAEWQVEDYRNSLIRIFVDRLATRGPLAHAHPPEMQTIRVRINLDETNRRARTLVALTEQRSISQALNLFEDAAIQWSLHHPDEWQDGEYNGEVFSLLMKNLDP